MKQSELTLKTWTEQAEHFADKPYLAGHYSVFKELPEPEQRRILAFLKEAA